MPKWTKIDKIEGMVKRYDEKLKKIYDDPIREKLKKLLNGFIIDNPDQYQQDFIITSDISKFRYLEVQVCSNWVHTYPYDNLFVYSRKLKYDNDTVFLTVSGNLMEGYLFFYRDIIKDKPKRLKKYSRELIYEIPWNRALKVNIDYLDAETFLSFA